MCMCTVLEIQLPSMCEFLIRFFRSYQHVLLVDSLISTTRSANHAQTTRTSRTMEVVRARLVLIVRQHTTTLEQRLWQHVVKVFNDTTIVLLLKLDVC